MEKAMKYIRTKDGRIVKHPHPNAEVFTFRYEILKQADNIEELCDGYVIVPNTPYGIPFTRRVDDFDFLPPLDKEVIEAIYGFIKTDKGLIYVAKMNDKGELELL